MLRWATWQYDAVIFICGGSAKLWTTEPRFDLLLEQIRSVARSEGALTLSGSQMYWNVMMEVHGDTTVAFMLDVLPDLWHPKLTASNRQIMTRYLAQCIYIGAVVSSI